MGCQLLLERRADVNPARTAIADLPLARAVTFNDVELCKVLLQARADPNFGSPAVDGESLGTAKRESWFSISSPGIPELLEEFGANPAVLQSALSCSFDLNEL